MLITNQFTGINIKGAYELFSLIADTQLPIGYRLNSWDFSSMFTNIPFDVTTRIIRQYYFLIEKETQVPVDLFIGALNFFVDKIAFFTYKDKMYNTKKGLSNG